MEKAIKEGKEEEGKPIDITKWNEKNQPSLCCHHPGEIKLHIPDTLMPKDFPPSPNIHVIKSKKEKAMKLQYPTLLKSPFRGQKPSGM